MAGIQTRYPVEESSLRSPPSSYQYPDRVLLELEKTIRQGGLALDIGSGRRAFGADRLVQVEICKYPFTDVVHQSEELPFADEVFDLSFSLAVTEHVERPWRLATEIQRVTKPGGDIIVDAAFLQPVHGYPSHFFNMTRSALESLFPDTEVLSLEAAPYQHPWFSIRWILGALLADLEPGSRSMLGAMTIDQLLTETNRFCEGQRTALRDVALPVSKVDELAAGFTIHCRKRRS
ncbi:MAG TPA: class I SAM-dependent methyltransferase [Vicinamibacteria bacterium]|nr:class I SAM-dependent methyltransferase [Vicinamibacteria bacterium]